MVERAGTYRSHYFVVGAKTVNTFSAYYARVVEIHYVSFPEFGVSDEDV